jgi:hypothetical protein
MNGGKDYERLIVTLTSLTLILKTYLADLGMYHAIANFKMPSRCFVGIKEAALLLFKGFDHFLEQSTSLRFGQSIVARNICYNESLILLVSFASANTVALAHGNVGIENINEIHVVAALVLVFGRVFLSTF